MMALMLHGFKVATFTFLLSIFLLACRVLSLSQRIIRGVYCCFPFRVLLDRLYLRSRLLQYFLRFHLSFKDDHHRTIDDTMLATFRHESNLDIKSERITHQSDDMLHCITSYDGNRSKERCTTVVLVMDTNSLVVDLPCWLNSLVSCGSVEIWILVIKSSAYLPNSELRISQAFSIIRSHGTRASNSEQRYIFVASSICCNGLLRWFQKSSYHCFDSSLSHLVLIAPVILTNTTVSSVLSRILDGLWCLGHCQKLSAWRSILCSKPSAYLHLGLLLLLGYWQESGTAAGYNEVAVKHGFIHSFFNLVPGAFSPLERPSLCAFDNITLYLPVQAGHFPANIHSVASKTSELDMLSMDYLYSVIQERLH